MASDATIIPWSWGHPGEYHRIWWDGPVYKYVDLIHAEAVAAGSVKIGTLWGYGSIEGNKRDDSENSLDINFSNKDILSSDSTHDQIILRSMGLIAPPGITIDMQGANIKVRGADFWTCCFSKSDKVSEFYAEAHQAIFRIDDMEQWVNRLCQIIPALGPATCSEVVYQERTSGKIADGRAISSPFVKPPRFSNESEVRVVWDFKSLINAPRPSLQPTGPDSTIASLLIRVA